MKSPQFRSLRVSDVRAADYNPARRVLKENIRELTDSMSRVGLLYPTLVTADNRVIDGHRRLAAAKELGWDVIPAFVTDSEPDEVYATVNATSRKMGGNDALSVWLKRPMAVTPLMRARFETMLSILGAKRVDAICKAGWSLKIFNRAQQVARYCDRQDNETVCQITDWLLKHPVASVVVSAMTVGESPATILRAVRTDRPLKMRAAVA
jgi:hypothetical protein